MENPNTWNDIQKIIHEGICEWEEAINENIPSYSLEATIYHKLKEHGYLNESANQVSRCIK